MKDESCRPMVIRVFAEPSSDTHLHADIAVVTQRKSRLVMSIKDKRCYLRRENILTSIYSVRIEFKLSLHFSEDLSLM